MRGAAAQLARRLRRPAAATAAVQSTRVPAPAARLAARFLTRDEEEAAKAKYGLEYVDNIKDEAVLANPNAVLLWTHQKWESDQYLREGFYWTQNWGIDHTREPHELPEKRTETDANVGITFIDLTGKEHRVRAFVGEDLLTTARRYKIPIDGTCEGEWEPEEVYGTGPHCGRCAMLLSDRAWDSVEMPCTREDDLLAAEQPYYYANSPPGVNTSKVRMGCAVPVTEEMDNSKVVLMMGIYAVPDDHPFDY